MNAIMLENNRSLNDLTSILDKNDYIIIHGNPVIIKSWYRKLALILWISTQIIHERRIINTNEIIYEFTVRATAPSWRYSEASSSCSSKEREFNHIENDVRATAQTRASNRAIHDLIWIPGYILIQWINTPIDKEDTIPSNNISSDPITFNQKKLLTNLIYRNYPEWDTRTQYLNRVNTLTKEEAKTHIKKLFPPINK